MKQLAFIILFLLSSSLALADPTVTPPANAPANTTTAPQEPGSIVQEVYNLALMVGGLLAFGAIVFGAIQYTLAAGNPSGQHEGREWITQALLGLLLLVGAALVLKTINPELITLKLPGSDVMPPLENKPDTNQAGPTLLSCTPPSKIVVQADGSKKCVAANQPGNTNCTQVPACQFSNSANPSTCPTFVAPCNSDPGAIVGTQAGGRCVALSYYTSRPMTENSGLTTQCK